MTTKEYLQRIYRSRQKIRRLEFACDVIRQQMAGISSPSFEAPVQSSAHDRMPALMDRLNKRTDALTREMARCVLLAEQISDEIELIDDEKLKLLLQLRYINCWSWDKISAEMAYDVRHIHRLHAIALNKFQHVISCHT